MPASSQGRWIDLQLRPAARLTWWGPAWALLCGTIASGGWELAGRDALRFGLALFLVDPVLGAVWGSLEALAAEIATPEAAPATDLRRAWPVRLLARLGRRLAGLWSPTGASLLLTVPVAVALSIVLGPAVSGLIFVCIPLAVLSLALFGPRSRVWALVRALLEVTLTWVVGYVLFRPGGMTLPALDLADPAWPVLLHWLRAHGPATLLALLFALTYFSVLRLSQGVQGAGGWGLFLPAQIGVALLLVGLRQPLFAAGILLLVTAQALFRPWLTRRGGIWFLRQTQFYVMAVMLVAALGLRWVGMQS